MNHNMLTQVHNRIYPPYKPYIMRRVRPPRLFDLQDICAYDREKRETWLIIHAMGEFYAYGIDTPPDFFEHRLVEKLLDDRINDQPHIMQEVLEEVKQWAVEYHMENTPRIKVKNRVLRNTLLKAVRRTFCGYYVNRLGVGRKTQENVKSGGFIAKPALEFMVFKMFAAEVIPPDVLSAFGNEKKCRFIGKKLAELLD